MDVSESRRASHSKSYIHLRLFAIVILQWILLKPLKRRIPKHNAPPIDITGPNQFNNGNIEVIQPETMPNNTQAKVAVDEVLINGRRYRVPERVIVLDFWNRINGTYGIQSQ